MLYLASWDAIKAYCKISFWTNIQDSWYSHCLLSRLLGKNVSKSIKAMRVSDPLPNFYKRKDNFDGKCNTSLNVEILCNLAWSRYKGLAIREGWWLIKNSFEQWPSNPIMVKYLQQSWTNWYSIWHNCQNITETHESPYIQLIDYNSDQPNEEWWCNK